MPESPDFEQIADRFWGEVRQTTTPPSQWPAEFRREFTEQLRHVWNARGAADVVAVESRLMSDSSMTAAIKELDR